MAGHIPDALSLIKLCNYIVAIGCVLRLKEDVIEHRLFFFAITKGLRDVNRVCINMRVVDERVVVGVIGTLPSQHDFVLVAGIAVNKAFIGIELCVITDAKGIVGITGIELARCRCRKLCWPC